MNYPKISIVTPSFNSEKYLEQTIQSVLNQNYPNLEYIIIDGGSSDNSVSIIKKYEKYLFYWLSENDNGMYDAIQKGFEKSSGEIMAWINSDDMYHRNAFNNVVKILQSFPDVKWLQGNPTTFDKTGEIVLSRPIRRWSKYNYYLKHKGWIQQESTFWKRSLWDKVGSRLNTNLKYAGDFELWLKFFRYEKLYITNILLAGFRVSNEQLTSAHYNEYLQEVDTCLAKENLDEFTLKRINEINFFKKIIRLTSRINIGSLKLKYHKLFDYPPQIIFNTASQKFELLLADGYTYFD